MDEKGVCPEYVGARLSLFEFTHSQECFIGSKQDSWCFCAHLARWGTVGLAFEASVKAGGPVSQREVTPGL